MKLFLIYADDFIKWDNELNDFQYNDQYFGYFLDAHEYARKKYGKKYVLKTSNK